MSDATLLAVDRTANPPQRVYLHCLPRALMSKWVAALRAEDPDSDYVHLEQLGTPEDRITTVIDTADLLPTREEAMSLHRSQTSPYEVMSPDLRREFLSAERLTRVVPVWAFAHYAKTPPAQLARLTDWWNDRRKPRPETAQLAVAAS